MEGLSTTDVLRAAAEQIAFEDRLSSSDAMFRASEEIALERGMSSPVKQRPVLSPRSASRIEESSFSKSAPIEYHSIDAVSNSVKFNPNLTTNAIMDLPAESLAVTQVINDGANELLQQMGVPIVDNPPKLKFDPVDEEAEARQIARDAAKLQEDLDKKDAARLAARRAMLKSPPRHRYGSGPLTKSADGLAFDQSRASEYSKATVHSSLSAVGVVLNKLGPRDSSGREALFRAMKSVTVKKESRQSELVRLAQSKMNPNLRESRDDAKSGIATKEAVANDTRLSRPKSASSIGNNPTRAADRKMRYTLLDEVENCTFKPKLTSSTAESSRKRGGDEEDEKSTFIVRQEATERGRREELEFSIGKAAYDARVDKKQCPKCGAKQSYDEVKEKRKQCPNCRVDYCLKVTWNKVGKKFLEKTKECERRAAEEKEKIRKEVIEESKVVERRVYDKEKGKTVVVVEKIEPAIWNEEVENEFFDRMAAKLALREKKKKSLEDKIIAEKCPFKPHISSSSSRLNQQLEEDEDADDEDLTTFEKFLKRVDEDLENRMQSNPQRYAKKRVDEAPTAFKV